MTGSYSHTANQALTRIVESVREAMEKSQPVTIVGGGTKGFLFREHLGVQIPLSNLSGIVSYEPTELVVTALAGTTLKELECVLKASNQMLGFEPPRFGEQSTIGGVISSGFSGPARPYNGAVRDHVLGVALVNGKGEQLRFGGQVIKNVAGYDISRLTAGSFGTLGILTEVSLRVFPIPETTVTLVWELETKRAMKYLQKISKSPWPTTADAVFEGKLFVRLAGGPKMIGDAIRLLSPDSVERDTARWDPIRDFATQTSLRNSGQVLWRVSVPSATPFDRLGGSLIEWGGAQRWLTSEKNDQTIREKSQSLGGHAIVFGGIEKTSFDVFTQPEKHVHELNKRIQKTFDPNSIFNRHVAAAGF
jgi:glycolate oxidase FAD binding subunit